MFVGLTTGRPSAKDLFSNDVLQTWITATNIRLRMIQTKTMLGHLMSVAQGDRTVTRRVRKHGGQQLKMCDQDIRLLTVIFLPIIPILVNWISKTKQPPNYNVQTFSCESTTSSSSPSSFPSTITQSRRFPLAVGVCATATLSSAHPPLTMHTSFSASVNTTQLVISTISYDTHAAISVFTHALLFFSDFRP